MTHETRNKNRLFRSPNSSHRTSDLRPVDKTDSKEQDSDVGEYLLCRNCLQIISNPSERIEMHGSHKHTFANPQGIIYEIGCFKNANGCSYAGVPTDEYTWFRGFRWKVALCRNCLAHLGWLFISTSNATFNGLILNRLVESKNKIE